MTKTANLRISPELEAAIDDWQRRHGTLAGRSETIRWLLRWALERDPDPRQQQAA